MAKAFPNTGATVIDSVADLPAASAALEGVMVYQKDTDRILTCNGSSWIITGGKMPACVLHKTTSQTLTSGSILSINFTSSDTKIIDTDNFHSPTVNNSRITIPSGLAGLYQINFTMTYPYSTTNGLIEGWAMHTRGATETRLGYSYDSSATSTNEASAFSGSAIYPCLVGDFIQLQFFNGKNTVGGGGGSSIPLQLSVVYVGAF